MTRLPWQHGRSRTKSGSEKNGFGGPQDWFSRTTTEPSRQALTELVKQHKRECSDESNSMSPTPRLRSRTTSSQESRMASVYSDDPGNNSWYPPNAHDDQFSTVDEKQEVTAKTLLNKGSFMLRRTGSKMSLSSNGSSSTLGFTSPSRTHSINASSTRRSSKDDAKTKISAPFDFQHVTHTEQTQFAGLDRIDESELAYRFSTIAVGQRWMGELKGVEPPSASQQHTKQHDSIDHARCPTSTEVVLPASPRRPAPPPKDEFAGPSAPKKRNLPSGGYSPLRLSPVSPAFPQDCLSPSATAAKANSTTTTSDESSPQVASLTLSHGNVLASKPLPQLPVIHAVTTEDDSAREMMVTPLPATPGTTSPASDAGSFGHSTAHQRQKSSVALPRHYTLYPSTKSSMPNLLSAAHALNTASALPRHRSDMALFQQAVEHQVPLSTRTSMSFAAVDTLDWEAAVDEAWDADDRDVLQPLCFNGDTSKGSPLRCNTAVDSVPSGGSTPLMMAFTKNFANTAVDKSSSSSGRILQRPGNVQDDVAPESCTGLGISSFASMNSTSETSHDSTHVVTSLQRSQSSASSTRYHYLTRSSSQESVIQSHSSSVIETQRSSKSSVFTNDFSTRKMDDLAEVSGEEPELTTVEPRARPESSCLPLDILDQYQLLYGSDGVKKTANTVETTPDTSISKASRSSPKVAVSDSVDPSAPAHATRSRSNTLGNRPRQNSRVSYSLFPTGPQPLTPLPIFS